MVNYGLLLVDALTLVEQRVINTKVEGKYHILSEMSSPLQIEAPWLHVMGEPPHSVSGLALPTR